MKTISPILISTALLLAGCSQPSSPDRTTAESAALEHKPMTAAEHAAMAAPTKPASTEMPQSARTASATGTVEAIDVAAGKITLAHGPVDALGWPAMTMDFKATPEQVSSVRPGQHVRFEFTAQGMAATITRIEPSP